MCLILYSDLSGKAASSHNHAWSNITSGKPTTLSGYGITDGVLNGGGGLTELKFNQLGYSTVDAKINGSYIGLAGTEAVSKISPILNTPGYQIIRLYMCNYNSARHLAVSWAANGTHYVTLFKLTTEVSG